MRARDVFNEAREARIRIDELQERSLMMHERIGIQARAMQPVASSTSDPMRKVDDLIDWELEEYDATMSSSRSAIEDAELLLRGLRAMGYDEAATTLRLYYVDAMALNKVCVRVGHSERVVLLMLDTALSFIDEQGIAKVKEAGR